MSDNIDIPVNASGDDGVNRVTTAIDRLTEAMTRLGSNSALDRLSSQMEMMQATMVTGFANLAATSEQMIKSMGARQVSAIDETSAATAAALEAGDMRTQMARERARDRQLAADNAFNQAHVGMLQGANERELALESAFTRVQEEMAQQRINSRILDYDREEQLALEWTASLQAARDKALAGEALFAAEVARIEAQRVSQRALDLAREEQLAIDWQRSLETQREKELAGEATFNRELARLDAERIAAAETAAERQRVLNSNFAASSPAGQVRTAAQAQAYLAQPGSTQAGASERYGTAAAGAGALEQAEARLALSARAVGAAHGELDGALRQAESVFKGAAHEAGIYGLAHGQLIALLAGGALAGALHHIAETGAEVEFQLTSLNALSGEIKPIDFDKFIGITAGTMTSLKDAAEGMHALAEAGYDQQRAMAALPDVLRLASLGEMSVAQASEMAVESLHAFGKTSEEIGNVGDILVAVGSKSNVSVHKLAEDMKSAAVTGELFGLKMEEITATVGTLAERGLTIQPLSSALNKLYEPSAKTAKVMADWNLTVKDGEGHLKTYTQFLGELAEKVNQFQVPADALKQLGMSPQSIKAMQVMTQHLDDYTHLLHEAENAHGKMFDAMTAKEDTVEGAWKRLGSTVEGSLTKAFLDASPIIRVVEQDLMNVARSDSTVALLSNLASGVARLTSDFIEHAGVLATLVGAYGGLRMLAGLTTMWAEFTTAQRLQMVAQAEASAVTTAQTAQLELLAVAETEVGVAGTRMAVGMEAGAAGARLLSASFGWISLAVVAAISAFDLLAGSMDKADAEHQKQVNTYNNTTDAIQREIDRLKELEEQMLKTGKTGTAAAAEVALGFAQSEEAAARGNLEAAKESTPVDTSLRMAGRHGPTSRNGDQMKQDAIDAAQRKLDEAHARTVGLMNQMAELETREEAVENTRNVNSLKKKIGGLEDRIEPVAKSAAAREAANAANEELATLKNTEVTWQNVGDLSKLYDKTVKDIASTKLNVAPPVDKDATRAAIEVLQEQLRLTQMQAKSDIDEAKSQNRRGELGDLQLITFELQKQLEIDDKAIEVARRQRAEALKKSDQQKYDNAIKTAEQKANDDTHKADDDIQNALDKMATQELQYRAKTLVAKGQLDDAYDLEYEAKYAKTLANLQSDIDATENSSYANRLTRYKEFLEQLRVEGRNAAVFQMDTRAFDAQLAVLKTKLEGMKLDNGPGTGLASIVQNKLLASDGIKSALPGLVETQKKMASDAGSDPAKQKEAANRLKEIQDLSATLRNTWVDIGETISKSLTDAFGKGGTALGGLITTAANYDAKMKGIQDTLDKSDGGATAQAKAADDSASAQIKAYGDMSGAAKGFFNTNSNGYKALHAAEQAFRVYELTMAVANAARKITLDGGVTSFFLGSEATKTAAAAAGTQAQVAMDGVKGASAAAVGVATQAQGDPYTAWPRMAAMAAAMAALGFTLSGSFGGGTDSTAANRQAAQGTGTVLGDPTAKSDSIAKSLALIQGNTYNDLVISQGMLSALQSIQTNISSFASLVVQDSGIATAGKSVNLNTNNGGATTAVEAVLGGGIGLLVSKAIPAVGNLIGKVATAIFGGKQTLSDSGFQLDASSFGALMSNGLNAKSYADITTSGGLFGSSKNSTQTTTLGTDANNQIYKVVSSLGDAITVAGAALGLSGTDFTSKLNSFVVDIGKVSLKGMSSDEVQKTLQATFSKLGDQMAQYAVGGLVAFQQSGEGYLQTLVRVATEVQTVQTVFASFGTKLSATGLAAVTASDAFITAAGGLDKFTSQGEYFLKNFLTQGQQTSALLGQIGPTLAKYNLSTAGSGATQAFSNLVTTFASMGAAGATAYQELMNIAPAFKSITDVAKDLQDQIDKLTLTQAQQDAAARAALDPANQLLFDQLQQAKATAQAKTDLASAYQTESQSIQTAVDRLKSLSQTLRTFINTLQLGNLSPLTSTDKYAAALSQFNTTLAKAQSGDVTAQGNLQNAAQAFLQASKDANASNSTYQSDYQRVLAVSDQMATWADSQVSDGQANLNALYTQISQLTTLNSSVLSVSDAIQNLAVISAGGKDTATNKLAIDSIYKELLGRLATTNDEDYWDGQLKSGSSLSTLIDTLKHSNEYTSYTTANSNLGTGVTPTTGSQVRTGTTSVSSTAGGMVRPQADPYAAVVAQTVQTTQMVAQLASVNAQLTALRTESTKNAGNQVEATMAAGADSDDRVVRAVRAGALADRWSNTNTADIK